MSPNSKIWLIALGTAVVGALVGAGGVWAAQQGQLTSLNARAIKADSETQAALQKADELQVALYAAPTQSAAPTSSVTPTEPVAPAKPAAKKKVKTVKQFTYIKKVDESGVVAIITADYAQMLTGTAAANAAADHGDESPPPNDYYIVNDNKRLRKLKVESGITVTVTTNDDGTSDPTGHIVTFANWAANYAAPTAENEDLRSAPYWIRVKGTTITKIEQQYLP